MKKSFIEILMLILMSIVVVGAHRDSVQQDVIIEDQKHKIELLENYKKDLEYQVNINDDAIEELEDRNEELEYRNEELNVKYKKAVSRGSSRTINVQATAYTHTGNPTATGVMPQVGKTIAVDPRVIPLGSKVHIEGMGTFIAEDTGGLIKGHIIDIFMNTEQECINWGRQNIKVTVERSK
jgi:3D (Asp-Asp-Asp) domain-containing protein